VTSACRRTTGTVVDAVYKGVWQTLEVLPLAVWAAGTGVLLWCKRRVLGGIGITRAFWGWSLPRSG
jgi:uncharacterized protein GlcG (DUF336 family)